MWLILEMLLARLAKKSTGLKRFQAATPQRAVQNRTAKKTTNKARAGVFRDGQELGANATRGSRLAKTHLAKNVQKIQITATSRSTASARLQRQQQKRQRQRRATVPTEVPWIQPIHRNASAMLDLREGFASTLARQNVTTTDSLGRPYRPRQHPPPHSFAKLASQGTTAAL